MVFLKKKSIQLLCLCGGLFALSACDQLPINKNKIQCNDEIVKQQVIENFMENMRTLSKNEIKELLTDGQKIEINRLNPLLGQLKIIVSDVRTTKSDDSNHKQTCEATLTISIPSQMIDDANQAREYHDDGDVQQRAMLNDIKFESNTVVHNLDYTAQPTDDGKKIYVSLDNIQNISIFIRDIVIDVLNKPLLENQQREWEQQERLLAQQAASEEQEQMQTRSQYIAVLESEGKQKLNMANNKLNIIWNATSKDIRAQLLPEQRTWLKKRTLECKLKAQDVESGDEVMIARLDCEIEMTNKRVDELRATITALEAENKT